MKHQDILDISNLGGFMLLETRKYIAKKFFGESADILGVNPKLIKALPLREQLLLKYLEEVRKEITDKLLKLEE